MDNISINELQKMVFVYNALNAGWTVKKKGPNKYQFKKRKDKQIVLDSDIPTFIENNMSIDSLLNHSDD